MLSHTGQIANNGIMNIVYIAMGQMLMSYIVKLIEYSLYVLYEIIIHILKIFHVRHYKARGSLCNIIRCNIKKRGSYKMNEKMYGFIYGKYFIGYIREIIQTYNYSSDTYEQIDLLATESCYKRLTNMELYSQQETMKILDRFTTGKTANKFKYLEFKITDHWSYPRYRDVITKETTLTSQQKICTKKIIKCMNEHNNSCICYIWGPPGTGKSTLGRILAKTLNGQLVVTFNPWDSFQQKMSLSDVVTEANPTVENPLVILVNEIDTTIKQIMDNTVTTETKDTQIKDANDKPCKKYKKVDWTNLLDMIDNGYFPNCILLMTSNISPNVFDEKDSAYLRSGRIHVKFHMDETVV